MIQLQDLKAQDFKNLKMGVERAKLSPEFVRDIILDGKAIMWRLEADDATGIVLTQERLDDGDMELFIPLVAGKAAFACKQHLLETLTEFARIRGLKRITAVESPAVFRIMGKPLGFSIKRHYISKEI
jgi:hypothetical protein